MNKHELFDLVTIVEDEQCNLKELIHSIMNSIIGPRHHFIIFKNHFLLFDIPFGYSLSSYAWDEDSSLFDVLEYILNRSQSKRLIFMDPHKSVTPTLFLEMLRIQKLNNRYHPLNFDEPRFKDTCFMIQKDQLKEIISSEREFRGMAAKKESKPELFLYRLQSFFSELNFKMKQVLN